MLDPLQLVVPSQGMLSRVGVSAQPTRTMGAGESILFLNASDKGFRHATLAFHSALLLITLATSAAKVATAAVSFMSLGGITN